MTFRLEQMLKARSRNSNYQRQFGALLGEFRPGEGNGINSKQMITTLPQLNTKKHMITVETMVMYYYPKMVYNMAVMWRDNNESEGELR